MKKPFPWAWVALAVLLGSGLMGYLGSSQLLFWVNSPQGVYRLEFHSASLAQRLAQRESNLPGFYRLYRISPPYLMAEGPVIDLLINKDIKWPDVEKRSLHIELKYTGILDIPPECVEPCGPKPKAAPSSSVTP